MKKVFSFVFSTIVLLTISGIPSKAQKTHDWGGIEYELISSHSLGDLGLTGHMSVGYVEPSGKSGVYLDWGFGRISDRVSDASHTLTVSYGYPLYTGKYFSVVPKIGIGMATILDEVDSRQYYFAATGSATLRYYLSDRFYCGFDLSFIGMNWKSEHQKKYTSDVGIGISIGVIL